jgi:predicted glycosyltransferase
MCCVITHKTLYRTGKHIISDGVETKNSQSISSLFNTFFTSIGKTLANTIKQRLSSNIFSSIQLTQFNSTFEFKEIDVASVFKQLSTLKTNKSTGLDSISARLLKDAAAIIAPTP